MTLLVAPVWSIRLSLIAAVIGAMLVLTGITILQVLGGAFVVGAVFLPIARLSLPSGRVRTPATAPISAQAQATLLSDLGLSADILEPLRARRITTVGVVLTLDPEMLLKLKGFDERKLITLAEALAQAGFLPREVWEEARQTPENAAMFDQITKWLRESQGAGQAHRERRAQPDAP